ncbi:MAG: hypothetical protein ACTICG_09195 [Corynebacterium casei]|uniref:hypothetical protein n=1 Tax=Corynebacterium casei TaxID=160386 RepID=UPI003F8E1ECA
MSNPEVIRMSNLDGNQNLRAVIRRDEKIPGRIFCQFPPYSSLTHDEAINLANRLVDVLESERL